MTKYLVVDDSPTIRLLLTTTIKKGVPGKVEIDEADNVDDAVQKFKSSEYNAVFLDLVLIEGQDEAGGLEVLNNILTEQPDARVVVVSGLPQEHPALVAAVSAGAFAHVRKPFRSPDIVRVLQDIDAEVGRLGRIK